MVCSGLSRYCQLLRATSRLAHCFSMEPRLEILPGSWGSMAKELLSLLLILASMLTMPVSETQQVPVNLARLVRIYLMGSGLPVLIIVRFCYSTIQLILAILLATRIIGMEPMLQEHCLATMSMICVRMHCLKTALHFPMQHDLFSKILFLRRVGFRRMLMLCSSKLG